MMHPYSLQSPSTARFDPWVLVMAVIALALAVGIQTLLEIFQLEQFRFVNPFSALVLFMLEYALFDVVIWKLRVLHKLKFISIPNLNGKWIVSIAPSTEPKRPPLEGTFSIYQTYSRITITMDTNISISRSVAASIQILDPNTIMLRNEYTVDPKTGEAPADLFRHVGTNNITLVKEGAGIVPKYGTYYTDADRNTRGQLAFSLTSS